jgi:hypothetical protein
MEISLSLNTLGIQLEPNQISAVSDLRLIDPRRWAISLAREWLRLFRSGLTPPASRVKS